MVTADDTKKGASVSLTVALDAKARAAGRRPGGSFNLGAPEDFRVPDVGFHRPDEALALYHHSAALVVEVLSPGEETFAKLDFYAARGVQEVWVVDPLPRSVRIWQLQGPSLRETGRSDLLDTLAASVADTLT